MFTQYLKALNEVGERLGSFSAHNAILQATGKEKASELVRTINSVLVNRRLTSDILNTSQNIAKRDYECIRSHPTSFTVPTAVSVATMCRICGCPVIYLPPGNEGPHDALPHGLSSVPLHARPSSVLSLVSARETVHSRCLVRTAVDEDDFDISLGS